MGRTATLATAITCALLAADASAQNAAPTGAELFATNCTVCHGADGRGTAVAPSVLPRTASDNDDKLIAFLRAGSPEKGMPPAPVPNAQLPLLVTHLRALVEAAPNDLTQAPVQSTTMLKRSVDNFVPITDAMLLNPDAGNWLSFSRTLDAQRFSPLARIDTGNVAQLGLAWSRGLPEGLTYTIPLVYDGVMYLTTPDSAIQALDATNGDLLWEYRREYPNANTGSFGRSKTISMFADMVYFTAPDGVLVALDARNGSVRWETPTGPRGNSGGSIVAKGKVISNGTCGSGPRDACVITAHDAITGALVWQFHTTEGPDNIIGEDTWGGAPLEGRLASPWGLPGSYDAEANLVYWSVANPMPNTRQNRHGGNAAAVGYSAPTELYTNSTLALNPDTGELAWYYQHLPGDSWDLDMNEERVVLQTTVNPDPEHVRWINPNIERGSTREVVVNVGEGGGIWMLDKYSGEFIWATPFPFNVANFFLEDIDVDTGRTHVNRALLVDEPGEQHLICYFNTRSFWPTAYFPDKNSLYVPYIRNCLDMTAEDPVAGTRERRVGAPEPGVAEDELNGLAKVNLETGEVTHWPHGRIPNNSAILATAGNLIFWGDIDRRYQALNADTGAVLWETVLGGPISVSNITYEVDGRQYVAVIAGETLSQQTITGGSGPIRLDLQAASGSASLYVFALPD
jgi:PQQ-dependent dehydrogenase (methanol/ethanol family)